MRANLEKTLNDLSLLLVMVDGSDVTGLEAVVHLLCELEALALAAKDCQRLAHAANFITSLNKTRSGVEFLELAKSFACAAQAYLNNSADAIFPNELGPDAVDPELGLNFDREFLAEFIAKHRSLLADYEAAVVEFSFREPEERKAHAQEFSRYIRGYLHNIKGDAGSIGLSGIERATHCFEDLLLKNQPPEAIDELLLYKEWTLSCLDAFSRNEMPAKGSIAAIEELVWSFQKRNIMEEDSAAQDIMSESRIGDGQSAATGHDDGITSLPSVIDPEMLAMFLAEAEDHLTALESILLEKDGQFAAEDVDKIFRVVHSIKGASSYFNLHQITESSHRLESILDRVREGERTADHALVELLFAYVDLEKALLSQGFAGDSAAGAEKTEQFLQAVSAYVQNAAEPERRTKGFAAETAEIELSSFAGPSQSSEADVVNVKSFVKVDTNRLDLLVDSIGEMVIYSSMLVRCCRELLQHNQTVQKNCAQVEKFARELQDIGMSMRLDPVRGLFQKMSRLVWDSSKKLGKQVSLHMKGESTELDRTVIEKLADPLMHMVRNAVDHGIELPAERAELGKPVSGNITLEASQKGGMIAIRVEDDGRGMDPKRIREKALEKGLIGPEHELSDEDLLQLIFQPGFSTAKVVTDISGRGVGMDVVRTNIENLRGRVAIESRLGQGSVFTIELPITLAIIDGIEASVDGKKFIIPTRSVEELVKPAPESVSTTLGHGETLYFRGKFLPLFRLSDVYGLGNAAAEAKEGTALVLRNGHEQAALLVDEIMGSCQTVIKSLDTMVEQAKGFAGCSIMPDGSIGLIVDPRALIDYARTNMRIRSVNSREKNEPGNNGVDLVRSGIGVDE